MVIPIYINPEFKVGDIIISLTIMSIKYCIFTPYHEFTIISYNKKTGYKIKDNELGIELSIDFNYGNHKVDGLLENFAIKTDIKTSKNNYIEIENRKKLFNFIIKNCPNKTSEWSDYDRYDACKLKKNTYNDSCEVEEKCICHISSYKINNSNDTDIVKYLRYIKVKKLNDNQ